MTQYERLGGEPAVAALLEGLYVRVLADPLLTPFLENIDLPRLKTHQFAFITQALGGPAQYSIPSLAAAHARLAIEQRHFDAFLRHLRSALQEICAPDDLAAELVANASALNSVIVNTPTGTTAA